MECRTPTSKILRVTGQPRHPQWLRQRRAVILLHLFWHRTFADKWHRFLWVGCPSCHPIQKSEGKSKALTPTSGQAHLFFTHYLPAQYHINPGICFTSSSSQIVPKLSQKNLHQKTYTKSSVQRQRTTAINTTCA